MNKRRTTLLMLIVAVLGLGLAGCGRDTETVKRRYLDSGNKYLAQKKYREAVLMFKKAIQRDAKFGEAYAKLGDAELMRGDGVAAMMAYRRAVELLKDPDDAAGKLADIYLAAYSMDAKKDSRLLQEVRDLSAQLMQKDAKSFHGQRLKGFIAVAEGDLTAALVAFRQADSYRPKQAELRFAMAQVLNQDNNFPEAEKICIDIVQHTPAYAPVYDFLVVEYLRRSNQTQAEEILTKKVANNPKIVEYRLQQAGFYRATQRNDRSEQVIKELLAREAEDSSIRTKVGDFYARTRQFDQAMSVFQEGTRKYADQKTAYRLRIAQVLLAQGKPKDAIGMVDQALAEEPKNNDAMSLRASLQLQYGGKEQQQGAVNDLQTLIGRDPKNVVVRYNLARAYQSRGELDAARVQYSEAIKLAPTFLAAYLGSGQVALAKRDFGRAMQDADAVLKLDGRNVAARVIKTNALINSGNLRQARADLNIYSKENVSSPDLEFQLAITDFLEGRYKEAETMFRSLRERFKSDPRLTYAVAEVMIRTGRPKESLAFLKDELTKTPDNRDLRLAVANTALRIDESAQAEGEYRKLLEKEPKNFELYMRLGEALRRKGQVQASLEVLKKGQQLAPTNPGANLQLALTLDAAGMKREAVPLYENVVKVDPGNAIALNNLAFQYADTGRDLDLAMTYVQRAKQKMPNSDDVSDTLGWVYTKKKLNDNAIAVFKDLVNRQPKNPLYHYHLGFAQLQRGFKAAAKQSLQTALSLKPAKEDEAMIRELLSKMG